MSRWERAHNAKGYRYRVQEERSRRRIRLDPRDCTTAYNPLEDVERINRIFNEAIRRYVYGH